MMTTAERSVLFGVGAMLPGSWVAIARPANVARKPALAPSQRVQSHLPSASTGVDIPVQGSVKDAVGRVYTASATVHVEIAEPVPIPPPPPVGITFSGVTDIFGAPLTSASAGKVLLLKGTGFPALSPPGPSDSLRLTLSGRAVTVAAWTATSIQFGLSNTWTDTLTGPVTGGFEVWRQVNGIWQSLGRGGTFTVLPSPRVGAPRR